MSRAKGVIVAIDGPAGAGKSTISRKLAETLGYTLVDTGALYRAVALTASRRSVDFNDGPALGALASSLALSFVEGEAPSTPPFTLSLARVDANHEKPLRFAQEAFQIASQPAPS